MHIKCVIIGDGNMKTVLNNYIAECPKDQQVPNVFDIFSKDVLVDGKRVKLDLWNLAGKNEKERKMCYPDTDVLIICFSVVVPEQFYEIHKKDWFREVKRHHPKTPKILIGINVELRDDKNTIKELKKKKLKPITNTKGKEKAKEIKALKYLECSASKLESLQQVFDEVVRAVLNAPAVEKRCVIL